tara:strand:- start:370 stop:741 length:372 start_codon:yes stop_codon:yes gene_type:complete
MSNQPPSNDTMSPVVKPTVWTSQMDLENKMRMDSLQHNDKLNINSKIDERWKNTATFIPSNMFDPNAQLNSDLPAIEPTRQKDAESLKNYRIANIDPTQYFHRKNQPSFDRIDSIDTRQQGKK